MIQATLVGRLGGDPESKSTPNGSTVTNMSVACNHGYGDRQTTTWVKVDVWGKTAEWAARGLHKGDEVVVTGELWEDQWEDRDKNKRTMVKLSATAVRQVGARKGDDRQDDRGRGRDDRGRDDRGGRNDRGGRGNGRGYDRDNESGF